MTFLIFSGLKKSDFDDVSNLLIKDDENSVYVLVNSSIFDRKIVISATYSIQEFANVILDSDDEGNFIVKLIRKDTSLSLEDLGYEFNNRLINYANYFIQLEKIKHIKEQVVNEVYSQLNNTDQNYDDSEEYDDYEDDECSVNSTVNNGYNTGHPNGPTSDLDENNGDLDNDANLDLDELDDEDLDSILIPWEDKFQEQIKDKNDVYLKMDAKKGSENIKVKEQTKAEKQVKTDKSIDTSPKTDD